jgi:hypothetical protein
VQGLAFTPIFYENLAQDLEIRPLTPYIYPDFSLKRNKLAFLALTLQSVLR